MNKSKIYLEEAKRIIEMSTSEYLNEILKKHPEKEDKLSVSDIWAYRTGAVQVLIDTALREMK